MLYVPLIVVVALIQSCRCEVFQAKKDAGGDRTDGPNPLELEVEVRVPHILSATRRPELPEPNRVIRTRRNDQDGARSTVPRSRHEALPPLEFSFRSRLSVRCHRGWVSLPTGRRWCQPVLQVIVGEAASGFSQSGIPPVY